MAITTKGFEVGRMVSTALVEFKNMVDMAFIQANRGSAITAHSPVSLVDELTDFPPLAFWHSMKPGVSFPVQFKSNHTSPNPALPNLNRPYITRFRHNSPDLTSTTKKEPYLTLPHQARPDLAMPRITGPRHTVPQPQRKYLASPRPTAPHPAMPLLVTPHHAPPRCAKTTNYFTSSKRVTIKRPNLGR